MNLLVKSPGEMEKLSAKGLKLLYLGLESGSDEVLRRVGKGATADQAVEGVHRGHAAGMKFSVMVLLGLGGSELSREHARLTALAASRMQPRFLSALTWFPVPEAPLYRQMRSGRFELPNDQGILAELADLIAGLELSDTIFHSNHASNPLPLSGRLSRDKGRLLGEVEAAPRGLLPLRPAFLRGT
jgi:radical SAM superfamily enzyme YgiQ (UPF0313 family)